MPFLSTFGGGSAQASGLVRAVLNPKIPYGYLFNSTDYFSRTFTTPTNNKKWSISLWVKRSSLGTNQALFSQGYDGSDYFDFNFNTSDQLYIQNRVGASNLIAANTTAVFRDVGAWYHIVFVFDSDNGTAAYRNRLWVNNVEITWSANLGSGNASSFNRSSAQPHVLGISQTLGTPSLWKQFAGYMTEVHFVDGQALDPSYFGKTDPATGVWIPKKVSISNYGTNGFYLPFKNSETVQGFNTVTWRGTSTKQKIYGVGFQPDLVWAKQRSLPAGNLIYDSIRGPGYFVQSNDVAASSAGADSLISFDTDGFTAGPDTSTTGFNYSGQNYVAWCWEAATSNTTNTDGTITSVVRANPDYGFSIVRWTGDGSASATVGHGLNAVPAMIITKDINAGSDYWHVKHKSTSSNTNLYLNQTLASTAASAVGDGVLGNLANNQVFTFATAGSPGNVVAVNESGVSVIAYCFAEIAGYSKFGSYTGNGSNTGPSLTGFGFKPAFVLIKKSSGTGNWVIADSTRDTINPNTAYLSPNLSDKEFNSSSYPMVSFTNDGFDVVIGYTDNPSTVADDINTSGQTYIYAAFADTRSFAYWRDTSGNANDWQPANNSITHLTTDSPTRYGGDTGAGWEVRGNYCTLNPLDKGTTDVPTLSNGNLDFVAANNTQNPARGTLAVTTGKWYFEAICTTRAYNPGVGVMTIASSLGTGDNFRSLWGTQSAAWYSYTGGSNTIYSNGSGSSYGTAFAAGDIIMVAFDVDAGKFWVGKNGTWNASGDPAAGTNNAATFTHTDPIVPFLDGTYSGSRDSWSMNFGQKPFFYTAPSGFKALCTTNLS